MLIVLLLLSPDFARRPAIRLDYQAVIVVYIGSRLGIRRRRVQCTDWSREVRHSTVPRANIGSSCSNPSSSTSRYQWQRMLEAEPRGRLTAPVGNLEN